MMETKLWQFRPWFFQEFNEGYTIVYSDYNNQIHEVPFNPESYLMLDIELARHIVDQHNQYLKRINL